MQLAHTMSAVVEQLTVRYVPAAHRVVQLTHPVLLNRLHSEIWYCQGAQAGVQGVHTVST